MKIKKTIQKTLATLSLPILLGVMTPSNVIAAQTPSQKEIRVETDLYIELKKYESYSQRIIDLNKVFTNHEMPSNFDSIKYNKALNEVKDWLKTVQPFFQTYAPSEEEISRRVTSDNFSQVKTELPKQVEYLKAIKASLTICEDMTREIRNSQAKIVSLQEVKQDLENRVEVIRDSKLPKEIKSQAEQAYQQGVSALEYDDPKKAAEYAEQLSKLIIPPTQAKIVSQSLAELVKDEINRKSVQKGMRVFIVEVPSLSDLPKTIVEVDKYAGTNPVLYFVK